jgi:hypothetical protein
MLLKMSVPWGIVTSRPCLSLMVKGLTERRPMWMGGYMRNVSRSTASSTGHATNPSVSPLPDPSSQAADDPPSPAFAAAAAAAWASARIVFFNPFLSVAMCHTIHSNVVVTLDAPVNMNSIAT